MRAPWDLEAAPIRPRTKPQDGRNPMPTHIENLMRYLGVDGADALALALAGRRRWCRRRQPPGGECTRTHVKLFRVVEGVSWDNIGV